MFPSPEEQQKMWDALWRKLVLTNADHEKLQQKRCFSDETIKNYGFKTSQPGNRELIASLADEFPPGQLAKVGILYETSDGDFIPARKLCGYGFTGNFLKTDSGEYQRDEKGKKIREYSATSNPILIPYLDEGGNCTKLRPHKDYLSADKSGIDEFDENYVGMDVYCAYLLRTVAANPLFTRDAHETFCLITEAEFKATALVQCGIPALGLPGIAAIRNGAFRRKLVTMLKQFGITDVVICFDNECKDDPAFPNYKPDEWDRVDAIVYARYTCTELFREGIARTRITNLPDEWRVDGKADWDGALKKFVEAEGGNIERGTKRARTEFLKVIKGAKLERDCRDLFASSFNRCVEGKLSRLYHSPDCPIGGEDQIALSRRLKKLAHVPPDQDFVHALAHAFQTTVGKHYVRRPRKWKDELRLELDQSMALAKADKDWLRYTYYSELLEGFPESISNFTMKCDYRLVTPDGKLEYLLRCTTVNKESTEQHVRITAEQLCRRTELHKWAIATVRGSWKGGEQDTQGLVADIQATSAFREIHQGEVYGLDTYCNLWKFGDRAFTPESRVIMPDKNLVFWYNGVGYQTDFNKQKIGDGFKQGAPILGEFDLQSACDSFWLMQQSLFDAIGDYDGWLAFGAALAYAAHPEILATYGGAPGLWITGRRGSGKSHIAFWLIQLWGFTADSWFALTKDSTNNGVARELSKYASVPLLVDEFNAVVTDQAIQDILKNAFQRISGIKATFDSSKRTRSVTPETTPIVCGENSSPVPATRSRYVNISMLAERAKGNPKKRLDDMKKNATKFRNIIHLVMLNRPKFVEKLMSRLGKWTSDPVVAKFVPDVRSSFVGGTPYAAFMAAAELMYELAPDDSKANFFDLLERDQNFRTYAMEHCSESHRDASESNYVHAFWQDILNILSIGTESHFAKFFSLEYAEINAADKRLIEVYGSQDDKSLIPVMMVAYEEVYAMYAREIRKEGKEPNLRVRDLKSELKNERYWVKPADSGTSHRIYVGGSGKKTCWCFNLLEHPLGHEFIDTLDEIKKRRTKAADAE